MNEQPIIRTESTKKEIEDWLIMAIKRAQNPDPREQIKRKRLERKKVLYGKFGL